MKKQAYILIKDHKKDFPKDVKCRLINPTKTNIGKIAKQNLEKINDSLREHYKYNQWRDTASVINWFNNLENKDELYFLQLDIVDYYPSITKKLFLEALEFAKQTVDISQTDIDILLNARDSLLFHNGTTWKKKTGTFDVTMGAYDACEVCELVGLFILNKISNNFPEINFGLYRDDGLGAHRFIPGPDLCRLKKNIKALLKAHGLDSTFEKTSKQSNYLDASFDLEKSSYKPFRKPNDKTLYVHTQSNHNKCTLKQIHNSVNKRLNTISSDEANFNEEKHHYEEALKTSGHQSELLFEEKKQTQKKKKCRSKNITWFNPPYNKNLKTRLGEAFLKLLDKHFPVNSVLHPIINRHTVKLSYSVTDNFENIIQKHNSKILCEPDKNSEKDCNCRNKQKCPVKNKCGSKAVIYKACVHYNNTTAEYIGSTETTFKTRYNNHTATFRNIDKKNSTTLSKFIWDKKLNPTPKIDWSIIKVCHTYKPGNKACDLCLSEKLFIIKNLNNPKSLNKRTDIANKCPHRKKHFLNKLE